jgi:hypothetical protein
MNRTTLVAFWLLVGLIVAAVVAMWNYGLNARFANLEELQPGTPYRQLLAHGYEPYTEGDMTYEGRGARFYRFRSSSGRAGPKTRDFGVVVNEHEIIVAMVMLPDRESRDYWQELTGEEL